jgi:hypothetical protein
MRNPPVQRNEGSTIRNGLALSVKLRYIGFLHIDVAVKRRTILAYVDKYNFGVQCFKKISFLYFIEPS